MGKVLLVGHLPPCFAQDQKVEAAHYRTWQFLLPLLEEGHTVQLCAPEIASGRCAEQLQSLPGRVEITAIPFNRSGWMPRLQRIHDEFQPDAIVAVNFDCCLYTTRLKTGRPVWMDIYGEYLTIIQASRFRARSNRGLVTCIGQVRQVLEKGDVFSGCGQAQAHALVGELAMAGRLNYQTFGYEFTRVILPGAIPLEQTLSGTSRPPMPFSLDIDQDAALFLWCGGYNTWTDVETLFAGLEWAMKREPRVHFLSIGASTYQAPDNVYNRFEQMIAGSHFRDRFHLMGWRPWSDVAATYANCQAGLNIDALHYETIFGTRTRLVEMIAAGLPVITSTGTELSYFLGDRGAALLFEVKDAPALGRHIVDLVSDPARREAMAQAALRTARQDLSFRTTMQPLLQWLQNPRRAPDRLLVDRPVVNLQNHGRAVMRHLIWLVTGLDK